MKPEAAFKVKMVDQIRRDGGFARRLEDTYAVGVFDCILAPKGGPTFFAEAKIIRGRVWGPSPRQALELERVLNAGCGAVPVVVGLDSDGLLYVADYKMRNITCHGNSWSIGLALKEWERRYWQTTWK